MLPNLLQTVKKTENLKSKITKDLVNDPGSGAYKKRKKRKEKVVVHWSSTKGYIEFFFLKITIVL